MCAMTAHRHCERSEAIQFLLREDSGLLRHFVPRNDGEACRRVAPRDDGCHYGFYLWLMARKGRGAIQNLQIHQGGWRDGNTARSGRAPHLMKMRRIPFSLC